MTHEDIKVLLHNTHILQGLLIEALSADTITDEYASVITRQAGKICATCGGEDLSQTLAGMYGEGDDKDDNEVRHIISPAWQASAEAAEDNDGEGPSAKVAICAPQPAEPGEYYDDEADDEAENLEVYEEEEEADGSTEGKHPDLSFITINERALFRRGLFDDSKEQFDKAMAVIQSLTGYREAVNYLCNDLEWSPESNDLQAEFLDKLHECFRLAR